jgi:predicted transcriptional regulator
MPASSQLNEGDKLYANSWCGYFLRISVAKWAASDRIGFFVSCTQSIDETRNKDRQHESSVSFTNRQHGNQTAERTFTRLPDHPDEIGIGSESNAARNACLNASIETIVAFARAGLVPT